MCKDVYVFAEQRDGNLQKVGIELIGEARKLADDLGQNVVAVLLGNQIKDKASELIAHGADKVVVVDDEMLADAIIDLKTANKLGCKVMRVQYMMSPEAFERLAPYAELFDVRCGIEIHNPETPGSPSMQKYLEVIKKTGSKYLGFVPDFGFLSVQPNKPQWMKALQAGVKEEHLQMAAQLRREGVSQEEAAQKVMEAGASPAIMPALAGMFGFVQFHDEKDLPQLLQELKEILPYSFECHGKFHYLDEACHEASIPYNHILPLLAKEGYNGYLICEYEDELYCGGTEFTKRQMIMERTLLGD